MMKLPGSLLASIASSSHYRMQGALVLSLCFHWKISDSPLGLRRGEKSGQQREKDAVIRIRGARQHNLKNLDLTIAHGKLTVVTGPSGSGKSSLAFHTLYAEGQRRYVETFSPYVRQFFDRMDKPEVDEIDGILPAIAIRQKNHVRTTRSTVGTLTEINDYLKVYFGRASQGYDPQTGEEIKPDSPESALAWLLAERLNQNILLLFSARVPEGATPGDFSPCWCSRDFCAW